MPRFPKKEADILALAERLLAGLKENPALFPNPPHPPNQPGNGLRWFINLYQVHRKNSLAARAAAAEATIDKDEALENLVDAMKTDLSYAENATGGADDKLKLIGWAGKAAPTPLAPPGQPRLLEAVKQGADWLILDWKAPADGGQPNAYKVQRRREAGETVNDRRWVDVATAIETEATLVDQPRGAQLEYRVIAINKAGDGLVSNTVAVVL